MMNGPIEKGPDRLSQLSKVRASGRRVTSPVTAINFAEPDPVQIGHVGGNLLDKPPMILVRMAD
jgi:hypothetical protein